MGSVGFAFVILCLTGRLEVGAAFGITLFLVLSALIGVGRLFTGGKRKTVVKVKRPAKAAKTTEPKAPTKGDTLRKARVELEEALAVIAGLAMDEDEKDVLRERARDAYLDKVSPYLT